MANFNFNKVILGGRLTADPELKTTATGVSVTSFSIAVNRRFSGKNGEDNQADFINVTAWRQTAGRQTIPRRQTAGRQTTAW